MKNCSKKNHDYKEDCNHKKDYDHKEKCDCCCTPGIRNELERLIGRNVFIALRYGYVTGILAYVDCDIARVVSNFGFGGGVPVEYNYLTSVSVCEIASVSEFPGYFPGPSINQPQTQTNIEK